MSSRLAREALTELRAYRPKPPLPTKLDANECPWPLPAEARRRIGEVVAAIDFHRYPDPRADTLREAVAARVGGAPDDLLLGAGSDEAIALLMTALCRPRHGTESVVLFPEPTFVMYGISARAHGMRPVGVPLNDAFGLDGDAMRAALETHRPNLVFLASPNNPTGNRFDDAVIEHLVTADPEALFVIDEAYGPFSDETSAELCDRHDNVALLGTLSKIGLAAARVGWCRLPSSLAELVDRARQPFNLSTLAQRVAVLALTELSPILDDHVERVRHARAELAAELDRFASLSVYPSDANFLLVHVDGDTAALDRSLRDLGIAIRTFSDPALQACARITVGTPGENELLLEALRQLL